MPLVDTERMLDTFDYPTEIERAVLKTFDFALDERRALGACMQHHPIILCCMAYTLLEEAAAEAQKANGNVDLVIGFIVELLADLREHGAAL